jgi:nucleoside-diphosphate-sugar epimerase
MYIGNMKNKILITGAAGFLGGRVAKHFAKLNEQFTVITTSRRTERKTELENHGCEFIAGDLCDNDFCDKITQQVNTVVHCAALSAPFGNYHNFHQSNVLATQSLLNSSIKNGVKKFIFISTPSIYFNHSDRFDVKESDPLPLKMVNAYADTKLQAEQFVLAQNTAEFKTIALRPRAIIGAEDTVIFPRVLEAYYQNRLRIIGDGQNVCDMTCANNVIEAISCALQASDEAYGEAYNITDGAYVKFWDAVNYALTSLDYKPVERKVPQALAYLAATVMEQKAKLFSKKEPTLTKYGIGILSHSFTLSIEKANKLLRYKPIMTTYEGINEYILWHKQNR